MKVSGGEGRGTTPAGAQTEEQVSRWVRGMFGRIAPRYDLLNHLLSFHIDRLWRARTVRRVAPVLLRPGSRVMDMCCGTGDLTLALEGRRGQRVLGSDFCHPMLVEAGRKAKARGLESGFFEADALRLPLKDGSLDLVTVAFGFRNLANYATGLGELARVLRPGGMAAILEFSQPTNALLAAGYNFYSRTMLPALGGMISGSRDAYTYLPESVRKFPSAERLAEDMGGAGFVNVGFERMTGGIVALHVGTIPGSEGKGSASIS